MTPRQSIYSGTVLLAIAALWVHPAFSFVVLAVTFLVDGFSRLECFNI